MSFVAIERRITLSAGVGDGELIGESLLAD
jgi:hypothetical protein